MLDNYTFWLKYGNTLLACFPRMSELTKSYTLDSNSMGRIIAMDNDFTFIGNDFDAIIAQPFGTKFTVKIQRLPYEDNYYTGIFYIQDCEIDYDIKQLKTKLVTDDYYTQFTNIIDKEFNLSDIPIKKTSIKHYIEPLLQIYVLGDYTLTNYQYGRCWEQSCEVIDWDENFSFGNLGRYGIYDNLRQIIKISAFTSNDGTFAISQVWKSEGNGNIFYTGVIDKFISYDGVYYMQYNFTSGVWEEWWEIRLVSDNTLVWKSNVLTVAYSDISLFTFTNVNTSQTTTFNPAKRVISRLITAKVDGENPFFANNTFCDNKNHNLLMVANYENNPEFDYNITYRAEILTQTQPTEYGLAYNGKYFVKPHSSDGYDYFPIGRESWGGFSLWIKGNSTLDTNLSRMNFKTTISGFRIDEVFNAILSYNNIPLIYSSKFFNNSVNPITGVARKYPVITQITNLNNLSLTLQESTLATKNKITLIELIQFLKDRFNMNWHIQDNKLNFEHVYYYENNQSYDVNNNFTDLTIRESARLEKSITFGTNKVKYNISGYKTKNFKQDNACEFLGIGKEETDFKEGVIQIDFGNFYDDIGYFTSGVANVRDGYFFGLYNNNFELTFNTLTTYKDTTVTIQNMYVAMPYCLRQFHGYNIQGTNVIEDGVSQLVRGFWRGKIQEIKYPLGTGFDPSPYTLIKTDLGIAFVRKIVVNCDKRIANIELSHDID